MREIFFGRRNLYERIGDALKGRKAQGRKARPKPREDEYRTLSAWFDHAGNYHKLVDFIIEKYNQEWALMLIDLLERQFLRFREWLSREKPAARPLTGRVPQRSSP
jgi:hypothetical protein